MENNNLHISQEFIPINNYEQHWTAFSFFSVVIYFISLYLGWDWNNYFTLSLILAVQFFFWIAKQEEHLYLTKNSVTYSFLFIKRKINPKEYKLQSSETEDDYDRNVYHPCHLLFLRSKHKVMSISDAKWEDYDKIEKFIVENYSENQNIKNPFLTTYRDGFLFTLLGLVGLIFILFGFGLLGENLKSSYVSEMKYVESKMNSQPQVIKSKGKGKPTYSLHFRLKDFPEHKFVLQYRGFKRINGHKFAEKKLVGKEIGFFVDKGEYEHEILGIYSYRYFTSHIEHKNALTITGIFFDGTHILDASNYSKKVENNQHSMSLGFLMFGGAFLGFAIYGRKISYN